MNGYFPHRDPGPSLVSGVVIAPVVSNVDTGRQGTVTIRIPWGSHQELAAPVVMPGAGANRGHFCMPKRGDNVLVAFEGGDANRPYVIGAIWTGSDLAPIANASAADTQQVIRTKAGQEIRIDESDDKVTIKTASGAVVECTPKQITVDANGKGTTSLSLKADGSVELKAAKSIALNAPSISLKATNSLELTSEGNTQLRGGPTLGINAQTVRINC